MKGKGCPVCGSTLIFGSAQPSRRMGGMFCCRDKRNPHPINDNFEGCCTHPIEPHYIRRCYRKACESCGEPAYEESFSYLMHPVFNDGSRIPFDHMYINRFENGKWTTIDARTLSLSTYLAELFITEELQLDVLKRETNQSIYAWLACAKRELIRKFVAHGVAIMIAKLMCTKPWPALREFTVNQSIKSSCD